MANAGVPSSEHAIHFSLALGFQAAYDLDPGAIVFEWPRRQSRIDLRVLPLDLAVEVKFRRPIPSGRTLPATQLFGGLLGDFNKLVRAPATLRLVVFVSDRAGIDYLERSGRALLSTTVRGKTVITEGDVECLPKTARTNAIADGPWHDLSPELVWMKVVGEWHLLAWQVAPVPFESTPRGRV